MKHVKGRVIVRVDVEQKNFFTFSHGLTIRLERNFDNFDKKYTSQVLGVCIDGENIPKDAFVLFHHNSLHETYEVVNHSSLSGDDIASGIKIFSIMERDVFFWKMPDEETWNPTPSFATALRVFKPYEGIMLGVEPQIIKDVLFVTSGELKGKVVKTLKSCDYQITFRNEMGVDEEMIRFRPNGDDEREPEAIAIMHELTKQVKKGKLLVGIKIKDAKPLNEVVPIH